MKFTDKAALCAARIAAPQYGVVLQHPPQEKNVKKSFKSGGN